MIARMYEKIKQAMDDEAAGEIISAAVNNADETGVRVNGELFWVHVIFNELLTYMSISKKRGKDGMIEGGLLEKVRGILIHDYGAL